MRSTVVPTPASFGSTKYRKPTTERMNSAEGDALPARDDHARHLLFVRAVLLARVPAPPVTLPGAMRPDAGSSSRASATPRGPRSISLCSPSLTSSAASWAIASNAATARPTRASAGPARGPSRRTATVSAAPASRSTT